MIWLERENFKRWFKKLSHKITIRLKCLVCEVLFARVKISGVARIFAAMPTA